MAVLYCDGSQAERPLITVTPYKLLGEHEATQLLRSISSGIKSSIPQMLLVRKSSGAGSSTVRESSREGARVEGLLSAVLRKLSILSRTAARTSAENALTSVSDCPCRLVKRSSAFASATLAAGEPTHIAQDFRPTSHYVAIFGCNHHGCSMQQIISLLSPVQLAPARAAGRACGPKGTNIPADV